MHEIILIHVSGDDRPGITSSITEILASYSVNILDIGQSVIHNTLLLGILAEVPQEAGSSPILKDVLFRAHELGMSVRFEPVSADSYRDWQGAEGKDRHIITLLARRISAEQLAEISEVVRNHDLNIETINRMSGRVALDRPAEATRACVEFSVRGQLTEREPIRAAFLEIANRLDVDVAFQEDSVFRRNRRLVAFDMDSTLIETEVINELAEAAGVGEQVAEITEQAMRGEIDFDESFRRRVALLRGLDQSALSEIADRLPLTEGAEKLISTLRSVGYKTAILSGGFTFFGNILQQKLGINYVFANELEIADGKVTGEVSGKIVNGARKAELLRELADREGIRLEQVIAVGDGANDLPMLSIAGLGIAFRAKPIVKKSAQHAISTLGLDGILYLLGFHESHASKD